MNTLGKTAEYWEGVQEGKKHSTPAPETERRLKLAENAVKDLPVFMQKVTDKLENLQKDVSDTLIQAKATNGRVTRLEAAHLRFDGAKQALGWVWGILSVFLIAMAFGLFKMYVEVQGLDGTIRSIVTTEIDSRNSK